MTRALSPLIDQFIANRIQSRTLATLRDTLLLPQLPQLLGGALSAAKRAKNPSNHTKDPQQCKHTCIK